MSEALPPDADAQALAAAAAAKAAYIKLYDFINFWGKHGDGNALNERQGAQQHFVQLCELLDVPAPNHLDDYCFEKSILKDANRRSAQGFADVFKRGHFAWEYKAPNRPLEPALAQLRMYSLALDNPPLLIACDRLSYEIHTQFTGTPTTVIRIAHDKLVRPENRALLRRVFTDPLSFKPQKTVAQLTEEAAQAFAKLSLSLRTAGAPQPQVAHFLSQCVFCMFAEDIGLLAERNFEQLISLKKPPEVLRAQLAALFNTMCTGGVFGFDEVHHFNGGLFASVDVPALTPQDLQLMRGATQLSWRDIDVSIFGTLFERGLDPAKRSQLGAHYTDPATIMRIVQPVVARPLQAMWAAVNAQLQALKADESAKTKAQEKAREAAMYAAYRGFLAQLRDYRVLDPACGSGNFLFLSLKVLKDIEHQANIAVEVLGLQREIDHHTSPANVLGIELDSFAAELARLSVWIGELQWRYQHGYPFLLEPVLQPLDHIECRDALLNADGSVASWPQASVVVGNPPFLGGKKFITEFGENYAAALRKAYKNEVPGLADLVSYWFIQANRAMRQGTLAAAGLVATNSIRDGFGREVLKRVCESTPFFEAWSDEPWVNAGAAVRVSLAAFSPYEQPIHLNGQPATRIAANLENLATPQTADVLHAKKLSTHANIAFQGTTRSGPFDIDGGTARRMLRSPNPHGRSNSEVLRPWSNSVAKRSEDRWIIDFGTQMPENEACLFELPFAHCEQHVKPTRLSNRNPRLVAQWWHYDGVRVGMRQALRGLSRFLVTTITAKYRTFVWLDQSYLADATLTVFARQDDVFFGVMHSRFHEVWTLHTGSTLEDRPRYISTTCFETFAFPAGLSPLDTASQAVQAQADGAMLPVLANPSDALHANAAAIASAAHSLNTLREQWLNPAAWTQRLPEITPLGMTQSPYPDRIVPKLDLSAEDAKALSQRTLTHLYNQRPAWLAQAHAALDAAVATAYGWTDYTAQTTDAQILQRLLALNMAQSEQPS